MFRSPHRAAQAGSLALLLTAGGWTAARGASPGTFQPAGKLNQVRFAPQAVLLADGTVLVTGGIGMVNKQTVALASAERYDPCLLYTSPSPRDTERSRMPSSA